MRCVVLVPNTPISHVTIIILEPVIKSSVSHLCDNSQLAVWLRRVCVACLHGEQRRQVSVSHLAQFVAPPCVRVFVCARTRVLTSFCFSLSANNKS